LEYYGNIKEESDYLVVINKDAPVYFIQMKTRILLVYSSYSSFVRRDHEMLRKHFRVDTFHFKNSKKPAKLFGEMFRQLFFLLTKGRKYDLVFLWFSDFHAFLPLFLSRILGYRSLIIIGGFDAVSIPEIEFGVFYRKNIRQRLVRYNYRRADLLLPVDSSLIFSENSYCGTVQQVGVKAFIPNLQTPFLTLPTGYDETGWKRKTDVELRFDFVTVAGSRDLVSYRRKGIDFVLELAKLLPEYSFLVIGLEAVSLQTAKEHAPENVTLLPYLKQEEIISWLSASKVYLQLSLSEGLPNALCEAMLCECIPVGSSVNGIPFAIGDTGGILEERDPDTALVLLQNWVKADRSFGQKARERIIQMYPAGQRENGLLKAIERLVNGD